jgi:hypothetical protein
MLQLCTSDQQSWYPRFEKFRIRFAIFDRYRGIFVNSFNYTKYKYLHKIRLNRALVEICLSSLLVIACARSYPPLGLHPENPHYFLFRGKPTVLIGSTEHYGAVLNLDFNYVTYLDELAAKNLNVTRTFSGIYHEPQGAFGIEKNTLAPAKGKLICPWARSDQSGFLNGGNKPVSMGLKM